MKKNNESNRGMHYLFDNGGVTDGLLGRFGDFRFRQHGSTGTGGSGIGGSFVNIAGGTINTTGGSGKSGGAGVSTESGIVSIGNSDTPLDLTATAPDADNAIRGRDGKKLDEIIHLEENGKRGLVKLVENGVTRLFHNSVYTKSIYPAGSETHPLGDWVITKKLPAPSRARDSTAARSKTVSSLRRRSCPPSAISGAAGCLSKATAAASTASARSAMRWSTAMSPTTAASATAPSPPACVSSTRLRPTSSRTPSWSG